MNKQEYLEQITSKVFDLNAKKMVSAELDDHISERIDFYKEIGYDEQASEEKSTNAMGEAESVAVQLGELHNDFYNPIFDIILFVAMAGILTGAYFMLKKYVFCDVGLSSLTLSATCLSLAFMYGYCTLAIKRNKLVPIILSFFTVGGTAAFNYFILIELEKKMGGSVSKLIDFIFKTDVPAATNYPNNDKVIIIVCALAFIAAITFIFSLIYHIKVKNLANKSFDNKIMHIFTKLSALIAVVCITLCIIFGIKCFYDLNTIKNEYTDAYAYICELTEKCDTNEDIIEFVEKSDFPFEKSTDDDGNITRYAYIHNLVNISINFNEIKTKAEIREDKEEEAVKAAESANNLLKGIYGDREELSEAYQKAYDESLATFRKALENDVETEYLEQSICSISLRAHLVNFDRSYDRISTSFLELTGDEENDFRSCNITQLSSDEKYSHYKKFIPASFNVDYYVSDVNHCAYNLSYIFDSDQYKHTEEYSAYKNDEKTAQFNSKIDKIIDIVKQNSDLKNEELARLIGAKLEKPEYTREELEEQTSLLGSYFDSSKEMMIDVYLGQTKYILDDWYFHIYNNNIFIYTQYGKPFRLEPMTDEPIKSRTDGEDGQRHVSVDGMYYDKMGYCYQNADYVPYYTANGERLYYYCKTIEDKTHTVGNTKEYYITDRDKRFYNADTCFIDKNGYLCVNLSNLKYDDESKKYKSPNGNEYTKAFETSWDQDGSLLFSDDYNTSSFLF